MIRRIVVTCASIMLMSALLGCQTNNRMNSGHDVESLTAAKQQFMDAWTKQPGETYTTERLEKILEHCDCFVSFDAMSENKTVIEGWKSYVGIWGPGMNGFKTAKLTETRAVRTWLDGDIAITASIVSIKGETNDGKKLDMPGHLTLGWKRTHNQWRVMHEHMSLGVKQ